jgi:transglutaminase-like putative cysteine protease
MNATRRLLPMAEAALVGVTFIAVASFWRLFEPGPFIGPLLLLLLAAHLTMIVTRRLGWELWAVVPVAVVVAAITITWVLYPSTTSYLLPTGRTLALAGDDLSEAWRLFNDVRAPAPIATGFLLVAGVAIWVVAFIADWAAFRVWVPFEAVVPAGTMFVFASLLSARDRQFLAATLFGGAVLLFVLLHRIARQQSSAAWLPSHLHEGVGALLGTGAALVGIAVVVAAVAAPFIPGAKSSAVLDYRRGGSDNGPRVVLSPFVSVAAKLNELADVRMFTVESTHRSYWRETSLDDFNGTSWSSSRSFEAVSGDLPQASEPSGEGEVSTQTFTLRALGSIFMPAAFRPIAIRDERFPTRWDEESSTLVIDDEFDNVDGNVYTVESVLPRHEPEILSGAAIDDSVGDNYFDLPGSFPTEVTALAQQVTAGASTPFDRARALQDYLRGPDFQYDQTIPAGSSLETFLLETRRGFCQQFASAFAAMARAIGLPSRVAVGYTTGESDASRPGIYEVSGSNAHAWPEVHLGEYGWVPFEPTPGRGMPGAEGYTGVPESQAIPGDPATATTVRPGGVDVPFEGEIPDDTLPVEDQPGALDGAADDGGFWTDAGRWALRILIVAGFVLGVIGILLTGIAVARWIGRWHRRRQARAADERVRAAWADSVDAAEMLGVIWRSWETPAEYARRAQAMVDGGSFARLADTLGAAEYSAEGATADDANRAAELADHITSEARHQASREQRLRAVFDPRPPERWPATRKAGRAVSAPADEPVAADAPRIAVLERAADDDR